MKKRILAVLPIILFGVLYYGYVIKPKLDSIPLEQAYRKAIDNNKVEIIIWDESHGFYDSFGRLEGKKLNHFLENVHFRRKRNSQFIVYGSSVIYVGVFRDDGRPSDFYGGKKSDYLKIRSDDRTNESDLYLGSAPKMQTTLDKYELTPESVKALKAVISEHANERHHNSK